MATRSWPGLGPVFAYEWLTASRRWQGYALRSLLVLLLLLGLSGVWLGRHDGTGELSVRQLAEIGRGFYAVTTLIVLGLVGLAAPAAAAGAICLDKARGNLTLLFSTDLTDAEIVLGKLAARLVPVLGLIACAAPVQALATLLGGVDPAMPTGAILVCLACAVFGCTLALTLSVWGRKTHEVLLATYAFGIFWLLSAPIWAGLVWMLPWWARPAWLPGSLALVPYNPVFLVLSPLSAGGPPGLGPIGAGGAGPVLRARAPDLGAAGRRGDLADPGGGHPAGRPGGGNAPGGPPGRRPPRPARPARPPAALAVTRRQPGALARVASAAAVALVGRRLGPLRRALGWVQPLGDRRCARPRLAGRPRHRRGDQRRACVRRAAAPEHLGRDEPGRGTPARQPRRAAGHPAVNPVDRPGQVVGAFRGVPPLTVLPVLIAAAMATHTGFALGPVLIGGLVVAYGAAITSLGLALATWLPRMDRAIGLTAGLYVVVLIAAVPVGMNLFGKGPSGASDGFAAASPFWGVGFSSAMFGGNAGPGHEIGRHAAWLVFWIVAYGLVAIGLLLATLKTFNRCLGRIDNRLPAKQPLPRLARKPATWLPDAEPGLDLDLRSRPAAPLADPLASDH